MQTSFGMMYKTLRLELPASVATVVLLLLAAIGDSAGAVWRKTEKVPFSGRRQREADDQKFRVAGSVGLSHAERLEFLVEHNRRRSNVQPAAANMLKMYWSAELESLARQWASNCSYKYGEPQRRHTDDQTSPLGQNLLLTQGNIYTAADVVGQWYHESINYNYDDNKCNDGHFCTQYIQLVWSSAYLVGCSKAFCPTIFGLRNSAFDPSYLTVCYYDSLAFALEQPYYRSNDERVMSCERCPGNFTKCQSNWLCGASKLCSPVTDCSPTDINNCLCEESVYADVSEDKAMKFATDTPSQVFVDATEPDDYYIDEEKDALKPAVGPSGSFTGQHAAIAATNDADTSTVGKSDPSTITWIIAGTVVGAFFVATVASVGAAIGYRRHKASRHQRAVDRQIRAELFRTGAGRRSNNATTSSATMAKLPAGSKQAAVTAPGKQRRSSRNDSKGGRGNRV